jgi:hypothetical protein
MEKSQCPACGRETVSCTGCPDCADTAVNGTVKKSWVKPPPPPELANRTFMPTPPEMLEQMRREFDEAEHLAAARELERTGGVQIDDLIAELERRVDGSV